MDNIHIKDCCIKFNISRPALYQRLKKLKIKPVKHGRRSFLTSEQVKLIENAYQTTKPSQDPIVNSKDELISLLKGQVDYLKNQVDGFQTILEQQQALVMQYSQRVKQLEDLRDNPGIQPEQNSEKSIKIGKVKLSWGK